MKNKLFVIFLTLVSSVFAQTSESIKTFSAGFDIPLGPRAVPYALSKVTKIEITADDESGRDHWSEIQDGLQFGYTAEFKETISSFRPSMHQIDPRDRIDVQAKCFSEDGVLLFSAYSSLYLKKTYDYLNRPVWSLSEPGYLYFQLENIPIGFMEGLESAWVEFNNGSIGFIDISGGDTISVPGWIFRQQNASLHIKFASGQTYAYDVKTGQTIVPVDTKGKMLVAGIESLWTFDLDSSMSLSWNTYPEWGSNPSVEVTPQTSGKANFHNESYYGYRPIAVWVATTTNISYNNHWERTEVDFDGNFQLQVTAGVPVLIWCEYPDYVNDMGW